MKVCIHQTSPQLLDVKSNLEDVINKIKQSREKGADLIVFPELALTGYFVRDNFHEAALRLDSEDVKRLVRATKNTAAVVGFIEESPSMNFYNSALVMVDGKILYAYRKINLPNYGVFEERKIYAEGKKVPTFLLNDFHVAVFICNDMWHPSVPYLGITQKADVFVTLFNSSQGSMGSEFSNIETWGVINTFYARVFGIYNICANRVGEEQLTGKRKCKPPEELAEEYVQEEEVVENCRDVPAYRFWGGSEIVNPFGQVISKAQHYKPDEIEGRISRELLRQKKILLPYVKNDDPYFTHRELQRILFTPDAAPHNS